MSKLAMAIAAISMMIAMISVCLVDSEVIGNQALAATVVSFLVLAGSLRVMEKGERKHGAYERRA